MDQKHSSGVKHKHHIQQTLKQAQETRVTKKLYIVFKYSKLLNKYKMCSHDLHIGQYMNCPFLILFTCFPLPTQHTKMSANYSHLLSHSFFFYFLNQLEILTAVYWTKTTQTVHLEQLTV